jgi:hypothetical protein
MSSSNFVQPGHYRLISAYIKPFQGGKNIEISNLITSFSIEESLDTDSIRGVVSLYDTVGFLEDLPIRGEENIILVVEDAAKTIRRYEFTVYKVSNVRIKDTNDGLVYDMHFTSTWRYQAGKRKIIRSFDTTISEIVSTIYNDYYPKLRQEKNIIIEETDGEFRCVIPNYTPMQAMNFLASRAYSQNSKSCSFRFFETYDSFYFVSDEYLIKKSQENKEDIKEFKYHEALEKSGKEFIDQMKNIIELDNSERVNTMVDLYSGAYTSNAIEIDIVKKTIENRRFVYEPGTFSAMSAAGTEGIHSDAFRSDYFTEENERRYLIVKDYTSIGDMPSNIRGEQYISEIVTKRVSYRHHLNNTVVNIKTHGRLDMKAGDIIRIEVPNFSYGSTKEQNNKQLSGHYLVNDCKQIFIRDVHETVMKIVKYDWSN